LSVTKYRYHYMTSDDKPVFRYDNAPHHREVATWPEHKHVPGGVLASARPSIAAVLAEIESFLIEKITHSVEKG